jgi:cellulose biosynthesis protein BcsQ
MNTQRKARVIGAWTSKANVGKTTLLQLLAWYYTEIEGLRVKVWDADPSHESMSQWLDTLAMLREDLLQLKEEKPDTVVPRPVPFDYDSDATSRVARKALAEADDYDIILVDVGGGHEKVAKAVAEAADLILLLTSDSWMETTTLETALEALREGAKKRPAGSAELLLAIMMSRVPYNATRMVDSLTNSMAKNPDLDAFVLQSFLPHRVDYKRFGGRHLDEVTIRLGPDESGKPSEIGAIAAEIDELLSMTIEET